MVDKVNPKNLTERVAVTEGITIGELENISASQLKPNDLLAVESSTKTGETSLTDLQSYIEKNLLQKTNNQLGTFWIHPCPAGTNGIPAETNGYGDAILPMDGRILLKVNGYDAFYTHCLTRKNLGIAGYQGENKYCFKIDTVAQSITLPDYKEGLALYMGDKFGLQNPIFPNHSMTTASPIQPTAQPHSHSYTDDGIYGPNGGGYGGGNIAGLTRNKNTSGANIDINAFNVTVSQIRDLPNNITVGDDFKIKGIQGIACVVVKPTYNIVAGEGNGGGGGFIPIEDLDMNNFKIVNLGEPLQPNDAVRLQDLIAENNKITYRQSGATGPFSSLQIVLDQLFRASADSVNINTGFMAINYVPNLDYSVATKKYVDDNIGGGGGGFIPTEDLDMNNFKITNIKEPTAGLDAVRLEDLRLETGKILYAKNGTGATEPLQGAMDELFRASADSVNAYTGYMAHNYVPTIATSVATKEYVDANTGNLKSDRSVLLTGIGTFNTKQIVAMDDLKDSNIIVGTGAKTITTLDYKLSLVDQDINTINSNLGSVNVTNLQAQVTDLQFSSVNANTGLMSSSYVPQGNNTVATKKYVDDKIITPIKTLFNRKFERLTAGTIAGNSTVRLFDLTTLSTSPSFEPNNNSYIFTTGTNAKIVEKIIGNYLDSSLSISVRFKRNSQFGNATVDIQLCRVVDNSVVSGSSQTITSNNTKELDFTFSASLYGATDPFCVGGYYIQASTRTATALAYDTFEIKIARNMDIGY